MAGQPRAYPAPSRLWRARQPLQRRSAVFCCTSSGIWTPRCRLTCGPQDCQLVGRLVDALKRPFHQLVIYYVTDALARVGTAQMIQARLIESLQAELAQARRQLAAAEGRAGDLGTAEGALICR